MVPPSGGAGTIARRTGHLLDSKALGWATFILEGVAIGPLGLALALDRAGRFRLTALRWTREARPGLRRPQRLSAVAFSGCWSEVLGAGGWGQLRAPRAWLWRPNVLRTRLRPRPAGMDPSLSPTPRPRRLPRAAGSPWLGAASPRSSHGLLRGCPPLTPPPCLSPSPNVPLGYEDTATRCPGQPDGRVSTR